MKSWSVLILGEGFARAGRKWNFELTGVVQAADPNAAFQRAVALAEMQNPELTQASFPRPGAVINADEINEVSRDHVTEELELVWVSSREV